jgi:hypothetical protein
VSRWHGPPRSYWVFALESLLYQVKRVARRLSNHRAVPFSVLSLLQTQRLLSFLLSLNGDGTKDELPKK